MSNQNTDDEDPFADPETTTLPNLDDILNNMFNNNEETEPPEEPGIDLTDIVGDDQDFINLINDQQRNGETPPETENSTVRSNYTLSYVDIKINPYMAFFGNLPPLGKTIAINDTFKVDVNIKKGENGTVVIRKQHFNTKGRILYDQILYRGVYTNAPNVVSVDSTDKCIMKDIKLTKVEVRAQTGKVQEHIIKYKQIGKTLENLKHSLEKYPEIMQTSTFYKFENEAVVPLEFEKLKKTKRYPIIRTSGNVLESIYFPKSEFKERVVFVKAYSEPIVYFGNIKQWFKCNEDINSILDVNIFKKKKLPIDDLKLDFPFSLNKETNTFGVANTGHYYGMSPLRFDEIIHLNIRLKNPKSLSLDSIYITELQEMVPDIGIYETNKVIYFVSDDFENPSAALKEKVQKILMKEHRKVIFFTYDQWAEKKNEHIDYNSLSNELQLTFKEDTTHLNEFPFMYPKNLDMVKSLLKNLLHTDIELISVSKVKNSQIFEFKNNILERQLFDIMQGDYKNPDTQLLDTLFETITEPNLNINKAEDLLQQVLDKNMQSRRYTKATKFHEGAYHIKAYRKSTDSELWFKVYVTVDKKEESVSLLPYSKQLEERMESENNQALYRHQGNIPKTKKEREMIQFFYNNIKKSTLSAYFSIYYAFATNKLHEDEKRYYNSVLKELEKYTETIHVMGFKHDQTKFMEKISNNISEYFEMCKKNVEKKEFISSLMFRSIGRFLLRVAQCCPVDSHTAVKLYGQNSNLTLYVEINAPIEKGLQVLYSRLQKLKTDFTDRDVNTKFNVSLTKNGMQIIWMDPYELTGSYGLELIFGLRFGDIIGHRIPTNSKELIVEFPILEKLKDTIHAYENASYSFIPKDQRTEELCNIYSEKKPQLKKLRPKFKLGLFLYYVYQLIGGSVDYERTIQRLKKEFLEYRKELLRFEKKTH